MSLPEIEGYNVLNKLGSGSYSVVYKAIRQSTRKLVAIKCIKKANLSKSAIDNIISEIRLLKTLKHENIVEMKNFLWDKSYIYIVMEYCAGGDLSSFIKNRRVLSESTCKMFLQQLALALRYLRAHDICHMDLKPENLLLTMPPKSVLKVADFGFAALMPSDTEFTSIRGSPLYMAPEVLVKGRYDARADLWAVGVILYECLFGKAPLSSKCLKSLLEKIKQETPIELPPNSRISNDCKDLLLRLLKRDPQERITYEEFFAHPFLDLEHAPTPENHQIAIKIVEQAIKADSEGKTELAFNLYCDSLKYFIPVVTVEDSATKKQEMRARIKEYINRAEHLKTVLSPNSEMKENVTNIDTNNFAKSLPSSSCGNPFTPNRNFQRLLDLSSASPAIFAGLQQGRTGIIYEREGSHKNALETLKGALGALVPLLSKETAGERRELLHAQIQDWLKEAETIKIVLSVDNLKETTDNKEHCVLQ